MVRGNSMGVTMLNIFNGSSLSYTPAYRLLFGSPSRTTERAMRRVGGGRSMSVVTYMSRDKA